MDSLEIGATPLEEGAALITLRGIIGPIEASDVTDALGAIAAGHLRRVVVDCADVEVHDPDALTAVYDLARALRGRDGILALVVPPGGDLQRVLRVTGLGAAIAVYPTRRAALDDLDLPDPR